MSAQLEFEVHNKLVRYLAGDITLDQFRDWFDPATWDLNPTGTTSLFQLAGEIELRLAEFTNGHLTESELRSELRPLVETVAAGGAGPRRPPKTGRL